MNFMFCNFAGPGKKKKGGYSFMVIYFFNPASIKGCMLFCPQHTTGQANVNVKTDQWLISFSVHADKNCSRQSPSDKKGTPHHQWCLLLLSVHMLSNQLLTGGYTAVPAALYGRRRNSVHLYLQGKADLIHAMSPYFTALCKMGTHTNMFECNQTYCSLYFTTIK